MKKGIHYTIYSICFLISVVLIGLYFIDYNSPWCILLCGVGASLIGAVALGVAIDYSNLKNKSTESKRIFQVAHSELYTAINSLLMVVYHPISEFYKIKDDSTNFKYEDLTIVQLIEKYIEIINEIKTYTAPYIANNGIASEESIEHSRKQRKMKEVLNEYKNDIMECRENFVVLLGNAKNQRNTLLINDSSYEQEILKAIAVMEILGYKYDKNHENDYVKLCREDELIELGNSLKELIDCKVIDVLNTIGFDRARFDNKKGYFNIGFVNIKTNKGNN